MWRRLAYFVLRCQPDVGSRNAVLSSTKNIADVDRRDLSTRFIGLDTRNTTHSTLLVDSGPCAALYLYDPSNSKSRRKRLYCHRRNRSSQSHLFFSLLVGLQMFSVWRAGNSTFGVRCYTVPCFVIPYRTVPYRAATSGATATTTTAGTAKHQRKDGFQKNITENNCFSNMSRTRCGNNGFNAFDLAHQSLLRLDKTKVLGGSRFSELIFPSSTNDTNTLEEHFVLHVTYAICSAG